MKKSIYNVEAEHNGFHIIFNLLRSTSVILDEKEYSAFYDGSIVCENSELHRLGICVEDSLNERDEALSCINANISLDKERLRSYTIYTTTNCNARCPYCFEKGFPRENMDDETAHSIAEYIISNMDTAKKLNIIWFGGEPLVNTRAIEIIASEIKARIYSDVEFRTSMYTNGYLINKELLETAKGDWNLTAIQITLDGTKETYEGIKNYGISDSFERVVDNINLSLNSGIRVQVRLNFDESNFGECLKLIDLLSDRFKKRNNIFVHACKIASSNSNDNSKLSSEKYDMKAFEKIVEVGFCKNILGTIKRNLNTCKAGGEYSRTFLPNGDIIKCDQAMRNVIGNIYEGENGTELSKWLNNRINPNCINCKILPACGGGCIREIMEGKPGCMETEEMIKFKLELYLKSLLNR